MVRFLNNARKMVVLLTTIMATIYMILWLLSLDSQTPAQMLHGGIVSALCALWVGLFVYANGEASR